MDLYFPNPIYMRGVIVGFGEGIKVIPKKIEIVENWPRPLTPTDIISFLGLRDTTKDLLRDFLKLPPL